jgi:hypothetical protein
LAHQDNRKCHINGIAAESKNTGRDQLAGMLHIDANTKTLPERNCAPQKQQQPHQAQKHPELGDYPGMEDFLRADTRKIECSGKNEIEIEKSKRRNQEICLVYLAEIHRVNPFSFHQQDSGQYHSDHQYNRQCCEISRRKNPPLRNRLSLVAIQGVYISYPAD